MKFFGIYGCNATNSIYKIAIEARDEQSALKFCYDYAVEDRDSYEGFAKFVFCASFCLIC